MEGTAHLKRAFAGLLAIGTLAPALVVAVPPSASAACGRSNIATGDGYLVNKSSHYHGGVVTKPSGTTCNDLNLTKATDNSTGWDSYAGTLYHSSSGLWQVCDAGYIGKSDFTATSSAQWVVLCTSVSVGTKMSVLSGYDYPDQVQIAY